MKALSKTMLGAGAAALAAVSFAAPAEARNRDRDGIDTGDIITGVAILGGIAAIATALGRNGDRYGDRYGYRDRYGRGYEVAVNACGREAERIGRGQVRITDVDRTGNDRYRVRGVIEAGYGYDRGYDRRYDDRYDRRWDDRRDRRYDRRYGRDGREDFTCYARGNGRITDFNL